MPFYKIIKFLLFFLLGGKLLFAQNYPSKNYTAANELPNNAVRSVFVDSKNILWIGTENGVVRKENDAFTNFFEEDGLALNSCWAIAEDNNKNLWFGSYGGGVSIYNGRNFEVISEEDGLAHNEVNRMFSYENYMFIGTSDGVSRIDINTFEVVSWNVPHGKSLFRVTGFFEYNNDIYVATYTTGIYKISREGEYSNLVKVNDQKYIYSVFKGSDSIYSSNKNFYTKSSLKEYLQRDTSIHKRLGYSIFWDHIKTRSDKIFTAAWGIYDANGGIYEINNETLIPRAGDFNISSKKLVSLAYDKKFEKLYVGSLDAGLFEVLLNPNIKFDKSPGKDIIAFARTKNSYAQLLSDAIILKKGEEEQSISLFQLKEWQEDYLSKTSLPLPKHENDFYELDYSIRAQDIGFYDIKGFQDMFWINTNIGVFAIRDSGELNHYLPVHTEEINFTGSGNLIETNPYGGVRIYNDLDTFNYTHFKNNDLQTPTMVVNSFKRASKTYFLSVFSGLYVWENEKFSSYLQNGVWKEKKLKHITAVGKDLAISNEFGDVFIVNDEDSFSVLKKIPRANIIGNTISFLRQYQGYLIIGTEKGLTFFKDNRYVFLNEEQGLQQPLLSADVRKDILSIGSRDGIFKVDLKAVLDSTVLVNETKVKEILINNEAFPFEEFTKSKKITLAHDENTVLLKFSTNVHPYPNKLQYQYRLNTNENWSLPSSNPEIFLPFLLPNNYNVDIKVLDQSTGFEYTGFLIELSIVPPFWKTWWFALLIFCLLLSIVYSIYQYQIKQTRKFEAQKGQIQRRFEETKMEALLAQMNPHFIFNAMNSIQYYIMDSDIENATSFLGDFSKLIKLNLDYCTRPKILLIEEIEYLQAYIRVENTRFNNRVEVSTEIDPKIDPYEIMIPTMLMQTFVENVFVHAFPAEISNPKLNISFKLLSESDLYCKIEDNGIGFSSRSSNKLHQSKGVKLVEERLALLGYDVEDSVEIISVKNKGTLVNIKLKI